MRDFAPHIHRQRLIVEGVYNRMLTSDTVDRIVQGLAKTLGALLIQVPRVMRVAEQTDPTHKGFEVLVTWGKSGCQFYTWEDSNFFTCDVYSGKEFDPITVFDYLLKVLDCKEIDMRIA
jgi:S-adenosylmethionine decarboxylase